MTQLALAPGEWEQLSPEFRQACVNNAPTFLDETRDADALEFEVEWLASFSAPALLTIGDRSPSQYAPVIDRLAEALPQADRLTIQEAGHLPHVTHPGEYAVAMTAFMRASEG